MTRHSMAQHTAPIVFIVGAPPAGPDHDKRHNCRTIQMRVHLWGEKGGNQRGTKDSGAGPAPASCPPASQTVQSLNQRVTQSLPVTGLSSRPCACYHAQAVHQFTARDRECNDAQRVNQLLPVELHQMQCQAIPSEHELRHSCNGASCLDRHYHNPAGIPTMPYATLCCPALCAMCCAALPGAVLPSLSCPGPLLPATRHSVRPPCAVPGRRAGPPVLVHRAPSDCTGQ